jgi:hypothetical protein
VKDAVLAVVAVEKVYRTIPYPTAGPNDRVTVDFKVAEFLKQHFSQYSRYFSHEVERQNVPGYIAFSHAREDMQCDDLTLLAIQRKPTSESPKDLQDVVFQIDDPRSAQCPLAPTNGILAAVSLLA